MSVEINRKIAHSSIGAECYMSRFASGLVVLMSFCNNAFCSCIQLIFPLIPNPLDLIHVAYMGLSSFMVLRATDMPVLRTFCLYSICYQGRMIDLSWC